MSNNFIVGVKRLGQPSKLANPDEDAIVAIATMWMLIDGTEIPGTITSATCENTNGPMEVTVKFIASEYRTVDFQRKDEFLNIKSALGL